MHASMPAVGDRAACQARRIADIKAILGHDERDRQAGGPGASETSGLAHGVNCQAGAITGKSMFGKVSIGVWRMATGLAMRISTASTMKV